MFLSKRKFITSAFLVYCCLNFYAKGNCPQGWNSQNVMTSGGSCYFFSDARAVAWDDAVTDCQRSGSHLAYIETTEEHESIRLWLSNIFECGIFGSDCSSANQMWLGGRFDSTLGRFIWNSGELVSCDSTLWTLMLHSCTTVGIGRHLAFRTRVNDYSSFMAYLDSSRLPYICEYDTDFRMEHYVKDIEDASDIFTTPDILITRSKISCAAECSKLGCKSFTFERTEHLCKLYLDVSDGDYDNEQYVTDSADYTTAG